VVRRRPALVVLLLVVAVRLVAAQQATSLPARPESVKFAVIGDNGNGSGPEFDVGTRMNEARATFPYDMVIMLGDNLYGRQDAQDFVAKFERPYGALLTAGVVFYASLGNHDSPNNRLYPGFNMAGQRYYTYTKKNTRFFALDSNAMDPQQLSWLENALKESSDAWKICYFHHPLYSDGGRHGSEVELRVILEPLFVKYGVSIVLTGHDHFYERTKPQKDITYFVTGSGGKLRAGNIDKRTGLTAAGFDTDLAFMAAEITGDQISFNVISRAGKIVDSGVITRRKTP